MQKSLTIGLAFVFVVTASAIAGYAYHKSYKKASHAAQSGSGKYSCEWKKTLGAGDEAGYEMFENADFSIEIHNSKLKKFSVSSGYQRGHEGGYGACYLEYGSSPEEDENMAIRQERDETFIRTGLDSNDPEYEELFVIRRARSGFEFIPVKTALGMCGMGWSWPDSIELTEGSPTCKVQRQE